MSMLEKLDGIPGSFFSRDGKRLSPLAYAFLLLLCLGFFLPGIVTMPPTDRDESLFAQASKQMIETGNYVDIRFQDTPRYKKPIGIYWAQSAAAQVLNPHHLNEIWAYRVPSLIGATTAVLMTAAIGALLFSPATGLLAAIMMAGCVLLNVEARLAKTDAALLASISVAMFALARAYLGQASRWGTPLLFWTAVAAGVLIKGPVILLPILGVLIWMRVSEKKLAWFRDLKPVLGILYMLALVAPWFVAINLQSGGSFMQQSAGHDMLAKIIEGQNRGMMPPGLHLLAFPLLFFPFALFTVFAVPDIWKTRREKAVRFCLGWIIPAWFVFELSLTKLPHYVLPVYPAIALLTAHVLAGGFPSVSSAKHRVPVALIVGMWVVIGAGFAYAFTLIPYVTEGKLEIPQVAAGIALVLAQALALIAFLQQKTASLVVLAIGSILFLATTFGSTLPHLQHVWMSRQIVEAAAEIQKCADSGIVSAGYREPSLVFLAGTKTVLAKSGAEAAEALKQDPCRVAVIGDKQKQEFLDTFAQATLKPQEAGVLTGLNSGHGSKATLTLFVLP